MTGMVYCRGCGKEIHSTAPACPQCGAPQANVPMRGYGSGYGYANGSDPLPPGVRGWSWGALLLSGIWAIGNRTWIGLFAFVPYVGIVMAVILGFKGREWAWKNGHWDSVEHFNRVQRTWSLWGIWLTVITSILMFVSLMASSGH